VKEIMGKIFDFRKIIALSEEMSKDLNDVEHPNNSPHDPTNG